jgi:hypothetical protein
MAGLLETVVNFIAQKALTTAEQEAVGVQTPFDPTGMLGAVVGGKIASSGITPLVDAALAYIDLMAPSATARAAGYIGTVLGGMTGVGAVSVLFYEIFKSTPANANEDEWLKQYGGLDPTSGLPANPLGLRVTPVPVIPAALEEAPVQGPAIPPIPVPETRPIPTRESRGRRRLIRRFPPPAILWCWT